MHPPPVPYQPLLPEVSPSDWDELKRRMEWEFPTIGNAKKKKKKKKKAKKGRPVEFDPREDKRLLDHWESAKAANTTREAFARGRGISVNDLVAAQHREKYRRQRDAP